LISIVWFAVCDGLVAAAGSFAVVLGLRVLFGLGMGAEWTAGTTLAMENWPEKSRGIASGLLQAGWPIGYLLASVVAGWVIPTYGWRTLFVIAAVPALAVLPLRMWVPESAAFAGCRGKESGRSGSVRDLLRPEILGTIVWACGPMGMGFAAYYALTGMYPVLLVNELGVDPARMATLSALFFSGMLLGVTLTGFLAHRVGIARAVSVPALLTLAALPLYLGAVPALLPLGAFLTGALGVGWSGVTPMFLTSLFPADVRGRAVGVVYHVGACIGALGMSAPALLHDSAGFTISGGIALVAGCSLLVLAIMLLACPSPRPAADAAADPAPATARA
jgi:SHS family lactate transporter-like MFS transporter